MINFIFNQHVIIFLMYFFSCVQILYSFSYRKTPFAILYFDRKIFHIDRPNEYKVDNITLDLRYISKGVYPLSYNIIFIEFS